MELNLKVLSLAAFAVAFSAYAYFYVLPFKLSPQDTLPLDNMRGDYNHQDEKGEFHGTKTTSIAPEKNKDIEDVLGDNDGYTDEGEQIEKRIEVDLTNQRLYAYEGDEKVFDVLVSTGLWNWTPTDEFTIWTKLKSTKMSGGNKALGTYYYLPNVPYTMYFYNAEVPASRGFGIHGTYWHENFGNPMSHGCINMKTSEAEQLFYWANPELPIDGKNSVRASKENPGTKVIIYGEAPK